MEKAYKTLKERYVSCTKRIQVFCRDGFRCVLCGRSPANDPEVVLQIDHIIPFSKGGTAEPENLQTLCKECNRGKHNTILKPGGDKKGEGV